MRAIRFASARRLVPLLIALLVAPGALHAQRRSTPMPTPEDVLFADRVALSASLEGLLDGVAGLSDTQRDTVMVLEQRLRDVIAQQGVSIRSARRAASNGWPSQPQLFERESNAIEAARQATFLQLRGALTAVQVAVLDRNLRMLRDQDIGLWLGYSKPFRDASWVDFTIP